MPKFQRVPTDEGKGGVKAPPSAVDEELEEELERDRSARRLWVFVAFIVILLAIASIDSLTTKYLESMARGLADWTYNNRPFSFLIYMIIMFLCIVLCLPYGPLSVLAGTLFSGVYGKTGGILIGGLCVFIVTTSAAVVCFVISRKHFRETAREMLLSDPKLSFLQSIDTLIARGEGLVITILVRLAPLPKGPTNYLMGSTAVTFRDFILGTVIVNAPMCFIDVAIGASARDVRPDSPISIFLFILLVLLFIFLLCWVGHHAQLMLMAIDEEEEIDMDHEQIFHTLQIVGKPNGWKWPDRRLDLKPTQLNDEEMPTARRDSISLQMTHDSFSFQVISASAGWDVRIYPRDAAPRFGVMASTVGVLKVDEPDAVFAVAGNGDEAHAKNFHIKEEPGTNVTVCLERSVVNGLDGIGEDLLVDQLQGLTYKIWYTKEDSDPRYAGGDGATNIVELKGHSVTRSFRWW